jgi:hypothetical protein
LTDLILPLSTLQPVTSYLDCELHFTVNTGDIAYINAVLDSYDGLGIMRTLDKNSGHIVIYTANPAHAVKLINYLVEYEGVSCNEWRS